MALLEIGFNAGVTVRQVELRTIFPPSRFIGFSAGFFPGLGARDLWAPVEPRYAEIIRVMYSHGEWIVPTVNGVLYTDKPILYFWIALLAAHLCGGVDEWVVRLPAAAGGLGFVAATYYFGRDFFSARIGALAALVLATSFRVIWEARWAHVDTLFCFFFMLTILFGARSIFQQGHRRAILLAYACMALTTLTKGLIGAVLPAMILLAFIVARRDWNLLGLIKPHIGIAIFLLLAGPWVFLVSRASDGGWLADFIYVHHLQRYTAGTGHRQPFYYYFTTLPRDFLPWAAFLIPAAIRRCFDVWRQKPETQFCIYWFAVVFLFFSLSDTKRDLYLLPLFPPLALLVGHYLSEFAEPDWKARGLHFRIALCCFTLVAAAGVALPIVARWTRPDVFWPVLALGVILAAGGASTAMSVHRRKPYAAVLCLAVMMLGLTSALVFGLFPYMERYKSRRAFSGTINRQVPRSAPLYVYEDTTNDFNYYTGRAKIPVIEGAAARAVLRNGTGRSYLLIKKRALEKLPEIAAEPVIATTTLGDTTWYLLALGS